MKVVRHKEALGRRHVGKRGVVVHLTEHPAHGTKRGYVSFGIWKRPDGLWHAYKHDWLKFPPPAKRLKDVAQPAITLACMGELT